MLRYQRVLILSFVAIVLSVNFLYIVVPMCMMERAGCLGYPITPPLPQPAPGKYRILYPAVEQFIAPNVGQSDPQILLVDTLLAALCIAVTIPCLYSWFKHWADPDRAVFGAVIFGVVYLSAFHWFFRGGGIPFELLFVALGLALIDRSWLYFIPLVILASLNRETSLILVGIYAAYHWRGKWRETAVLGVLWAVITAALHIVLGPSIHQQGGLVGTFEFNASNAQDGLLSNLLFVPIIIGVAMGYRHAPIQLKRLVWVALIYTAAILVGGAINETQRLALPLLPLIIPLLISKPYPAISQPMAQSKV